MFLQSSSAPPEDGNTHWTQSEPVLFYHTWSQEVSVGSWAEPAGFCAPIKPRALGNAEKP